MDENAKNERKTISLNLTVEDLERFDRVGKEFPFPLSRTETLKVLLAKWEGKTFP